MKIWRYMDFTKFVSLINDEKLFFARADLLGDPLEGSRPMPDVAERSLRPSVILDDGKTVDLAKSGWGFTAYPTKCVAVNCWHTNEHESAAMWRLYLKSSEGIAIQSTYRKLRDSLGDEEEVHIGCVKYLDYETERIGAANLLAPFVHKSKSYAHENEIRAVIARFPDKRDKQGTIAGGISVRVDLEVLVETVFVAPDAPPWIRALVESTIQKYGFNFSVKSSKLDQPPRY